MKMESASSRTDLSLGQSFPTTTASTLRPLSSFSAFARSMQPALNSCSPDAWLRLPAINTIFFFVAPSFSADRNNGLIRASKSGIARARRFINSCFIYGELSSFPFQKKTQEKHFLNQEPYTLRTQARHHEFLPLI